MFVLLWNCTATGWCARIDAKANARTHMESSNEPGWSVVLMSQQLTRLPTEQLQPHTRNLNVARNQLQHLPLLPASAYAPRPHCRWPQRHSSPGRGSTALTQLNVSRNALASVDRHALCHCTALRSLHAGKHTRSTLHKPSESIIDHSTTQRGLGQRTMRWGASRRRRWPPRCRRRSTRCSSKQTRCAARIWPRCCGACAR